MSTHSTLSLCLCSVLPLAAAPPPPQTPFALQVTASLPQGDLGNSTLLNGKIGFGLGGRWQVGLLDGLDLVPRADFTRYTRSQTLTVAGAPVGSEFRAHIFAAGADINWYFASHSRQGFYLLGGVGYSAASFSQSVMASGQGLAAFDPEGGSKGSPYLALGFGGTVDRNFSVEFRYVGMTKYAYTLQDLRASSMNASVVFRY